MNKIQGRRKAALIITLLILMFALPIFLAKFFYQHQSLLPQHQTNHGELLNPASSIDEIGLAPSPPSGKWLLLSIQKGACEKNCEQHLYYMRQIQLALGKNVNRLQRVMIINAEQADDKKLMELLNGPYTGTLLLQMNPQTESAAALAQAEWYLVDPQGNIMMRYPNNAKADDILDDLEYLLRASQIG